jgi:CheY-like chemotaxis protein
MQTHPPARHILVVDDDQDIRETLHDLLGDEGYVVQEAADGAEAMEILLSSPHRLIVLLDLVMPRMNGFDVLSLATDVGQLVTRHAFIVLTANKAAADAPDAVDSYFATLLERYRIPVVGKPCNVDDLLARVAEAEGRLV